MSKCIDCGKPLPKDHPFTYCDADWENHYPTPATNERKELDDMVWGFAKYCNGLTPHKLALPTDPIVEGAVEDFIDRLEALIMAECRAAVVAEVRQITEDLVLGDGNLAANKYLNDRLTKLTGGQP